MLHHTDQGRAQPESEQAQCAKQELEKHQANHTIDPGSVACNQHQTSQCAHVAVYTEDEVYEQACSLGTV